MKKILLSLAILLGFTSSVSAQTAITGSSLYTIPSYLTHKNTPYIVAREGECVFNIYDLGLNRITTLLLEPDYAYLEVKKFIDKNGMNISIGDDDIYLTQTFFNEDADWEYIVRESDDTYTIKKPNGIVVGTVPSSWTARIFVINDVVYTTIKGERDEETNQVPYYYYTLPEFRRLISGANGVKPVPVMTQIVGNEVHDLMGREVSDSHKGVIIKDGKKFLIK